jgi:tetratricopeptide (TPR) repeat protein
VARRTALAEALLALGSYLNDTGRAEDALPAIREARHLCEALLQAEKSDKSIVLMNHLTKSWNLEGVTHYNAGRPEEAIAAFRELSRLHEGQMAQGKAITSVAYGFASNEYNLGTLLSEAGRVDEAMAAFRRSLDVRRQLARDHPERPEYRLNVAFSLGNMGTCVRSTDLAAAEGYLREAVAILADLAPKYPKSAAIRDGLARNRLSLADALRRQGKLDEAITLYRENLAANAKDELALRELAVSERMRDLRPRLSEVLTGAARPANPTEAIGFAELCAAPFQKHYVAAARLYGEAFAADPKLVADLGAEHGFKAARAAALAAGGHGKDTDESDDKTRTRLRQQALAWLRANLSLYAEKLEAGKPSDRDQARTAMLNWQKDVDLAGLRDAAALAKLPAGEREAFAQLWADAAALLKKAVEKPK